VQVSGSNPLKMEAHTTWKRSRLLADAPTLTAYLRALLSKRPHAQPPAVPDGARCAAVLAPLYARAGHPYLLFTQRSLDLSRHKGEISFPGGGHDRADASLASTALRETQEELGLAPETIELLGALPAVFAAVSNYLIVPYVGWLGDGLPPLTPSPSEVAGVIEAPLAALADPAIYHTELWRRGDAEHLVHFYDFGEYRIWGATARMLHSLLSLLPEE
jgi:8-oxo-dGTP pyrophosphatase MutT (NUDIX family)